MKHSKIQSSRISLVTAILAVGMITSIVAPAQYSTVQAQSDPPNSMSMSKMLDPTLSPESVNASLGNLILTSYTSSEGLRIPDPGRPVMEVSWAGSGSLRGNTNVSDFGTVWIEFGNDGVSRSHGQGMLVNQKGQVVTYTIQGIGSMGKDGYIRNHGSVFFNASSSADFAPLAKTVGVFADQINQKGNAVTKIWELK